MPTPDVPSLPAPGYPRGLVVVLGVAGSLVAVLALRELAWLLAPVSLAFMIVLLVHPLHARLRTQRLPSWLALPLLLVAIYAGYVARLIARTVAPTRWAVAVSRDGSDPRSAERIWS